MKFSDALLSYSWIGLAPANFYSDPQNTGYFTFTLNTADALTTGIKIITISAFYENYTSQENFLIYLNILQRQTTLNGETGLVYLSPWIWVQDTHYFTFSYEDANRLDIIGDLTIKSYSWYELDEFGDRIPGNQGTGTLIQNLNKTYYVDFDTELRQVGNYFLHIALQKDNYEPKFAYINLQIKLREFSRLNDSIVTPAMGSNFQISINQGATINFTITLMDTTRNILLQGAIVKLNMDREYTLNVISAGVYGVLISTAHIDTFLAPRTLSAILIVQMDNFTEQRLQMTVTVKMQEIFPGLPTFYFILITASVIGVVGSIVGYRVIQRARIPKHVKKIRKIKGAIKSKKKIAESISIPSKAEMIAKLFGEDWKELGLSIKDSLGIKDLKSKKLSGDDKITKEGGKIE
jgi:hypothetical protein